MNNAQKIQWKCLLVEAAAIVASILLAFVIDAWWDQTQQFRQDQVHLQAVLDELTQTQKLIGDAIVAHQDTVDVGAKLLAIISTKSSNDRVAEVIEYLRDLMRFYQINAPVGALDTATGSGVLSRMQDRALALSLANWPVALDDLLEEQNAGHDQLLDKFVPAMSAKLSMAEVFQEKINTTTIQGTSEVAPLRDIELLPSPFPRDFSPLNDDFEIENQVMMLVIMARVAAGEASKFANDLELVTASLRECLRKQDC